MLPSVASKLCSTREKSLGERKEWINHNKRRSVWWSTAKSQQPLCEKGKTCMMPLISWQKENASSKKFVAKRWATLPGKKCTEKNFLPLPVICAGDQLAGQSCVPSANALSSRRGHFAQDSESDGISSSAHGQFWTPNLVGFIIHHIHSMCRDFIYSIRKTDGGGRRGQRSRGEPGFWAFGLEAAESGGGCGGDRCSVKPAAGAWGSDRIAVVPYFTCFFFLNTIINNHSSMRRT